MAKVIAFANQKGGVGKTTTTCTIAAGLRERGYSVLCVDFDPQGNLSFSVGGRTEECATIYDVLKGDIKPLFAIQRTEAFDVISSNILLSGIELEFTGEGREFLLRDALEPIKDKYDYIFIDTPPALGILTVNAFTAADGIIIPINADIFSLQGIAQLSETIKRIKSYCNPTLNIIGIVLNKYNGRALLSKEVLGAAEMIAKELDTVVFKNTIKMCVAIMEAQTHQQTIFQYAPKNATINDYRQLVSELLENGL